VYPWLGGTPVFQVKASSGKTIIGTGTESVGFTRLLFVGTDAAPAASIGIESRLVSSGADVAAISGKMRYSGTVGPGIAGDFVADYIGATTTAQLSGVSVEMSSAVASAAEAMNGILVNQNNTISSSKLFAGVLISSVATSGWQYGVYYKNPAGPIFTVDENAVLTLRTAAVNGPMILLSDSGVSGVDMYLRSNGGSFEIYNAGLAAQIFAVTAAGQITMPSYGAGGGVLSTGAPDSCGVGFRCLRVPN
jgi:hypothetical protein